jgi:hypothetical protein
MEGWDMIQAEANYPELKGANYEIGQKFRADNRRSSGSQKGPKSRQALIR